MPKVWMTDERRRKTAGVPADVEFATKPALARGTIEEALDAGVRACWVTGPNFSRGGRGFSV
jgi:SRSO17 transposase